MTEPENSDLGTFTHLNSHETKEAIKASWPEDSVKYILPIGLVFVLALMVWLVRPPGTVADRGARGVGDALAVEGWAFLISDLELLDHHSELFGLQVLLNGRQLTPDELELYLPVLTYRLDGLDLPYDLQVDKDGQVKVDLPPLAPEEQERLLRILDTRGRLRLINKYNQELFSGEQLVKATAKMEAHQPIVVVELTQDDCNFIAGLVKPCADIRDNPWVYIDSASMTALTPDLVSAHTRELFVQGFKTLDDARDMALIFNSGVLPYSLPATVCENSLASRLKTKEGVLVVHWEARKSTPEAGAFQLPDLNLIGPDGEAQPAEPWVIMVEPRYRSGDASGEGGDAAGGYLAWRVDNRQGPWKLYLPDGRMFKLTLPD